MLTLKTIAQRKGINYHTLRRWVIKSKVKTKRIGNVIVIKAQDARRVLNAHH